MKRIIKLTICFSLSLTLAPHIEARRQTRKSKPARVQLLEVGTFHHDEVTAKTGENWLGLFPDRTGFVLAETNIRVNRVKDIVVDDDEGNEKTGKQVQVRQKGTPLFLTKGASMLLTGPVITATSDERSLGNQSSVKFKRRWRKCELKVISDDPTPRDYLVPRSRLVLSDGRKTQVLFSAETNDDGGWVLLWAGDMDHDGKLDFYMDLHNHYNVSQRRLFLSSQAKKGELVAEVSTFTTVGC